MYLFQVIGNTDHGSVALLAFDLVDTENKMGTTGLRGILRAFVARWKPPSRRSSLQTKGSQLGQRTNSPTEVARRFLKCLIPLAPAATTEPGLWERVQGLQAAWRVVTVYHDP